MASNASSNVDNIRERNLKKSISEIVKKLQEIQEDEDSYSRRVSVTVDLWRNVAAFSKISQLQHTEKLVEWVYFQTVHLVLERRWLQMPADQRACMHQSVFNIIDNKLSTKNKKRDSTASNRLLGLQNLIINPWRNPTLLAMFEENSTVPLETVLEFLCAERGHLLVTRLDILCETHCEDLALRLAELSLTCIRLPGTNSLRHHVSKDQTYYIIDVYLALLYKYDRTADCIRELKNLTLGEGLDCIKRFRTKQTEGIRIWKDCFAVAELASQFFLVATLNAEHENGSHDIYYLMLTEWALLQLKRHNKAGFTDVVRKFATIASSAEHLYTMCTVFQQRLRKLESSGLLVLELYIRAICLDLDQWELCRTLHHQPELRQTELRLSRAFLDIADLLLDEVGVCRECVLTAFSLNPSEQCYDRVKQLAGIINTRSNKDRTDLDTGQQWKCYLHPPFDGISDEMDLCPECGEFREKLKMDCSIDALLAIAGERLTQAADYDVCRAPCRILDPTVLKLPRWLCEDMASIVQKPREKSLSWACPWPELSKTCESYMNDREGERKFHKELKYLKIDYSQFKDWPRSYDKNDAFYFIEKGYECYMDNYESILAQKKEEAEMAKKAANAEGKASKRGRKGCKGKNKVKAKNSGNSNSSCEVKTKHKSNDCPDDTTTQDNLGSDDLKNSCETKKNKRKPGRPPKKNVTLRDALAETKENKNISDDKTLNAVDSVAKLNSDTESILCAEKKSSDPEVLQSLRKYRPHLKSRSSNKSQVKDFAEEFAPMLGDHLSPRVVLDYLDTKNLKKKPNQDPIAKLNLNNNNVDKSFCEDDQRGSHKTKRNLSRKCNILSEIPGLSSFDMLIPERIQPVVQIVQLAQNTNKQQPNSSPKVSRSSNQPNMSVVTSMPSTSADVNTTSSQSEILSTPVTPHIQRIGQATLNCDPAQIVSPTISVATNSQQSNSQAPQTSSATLPDLVPASQSLEDNAVSAVSTSHTNTNLVQASPARQKLTNTSLANLLTTNRLVMPTKSTVQSKSNPTIINVLSQKILRAPYSSSISNCSSVTSTTQSTSHSPMTSVSAVRQVAATSVQNSIRSQAPGTHIATASQTPQQLLQILNSPHKSGSSQVIKGVNLISTLSGQPESKMVQFICKTDGKTFQLTPFSTNPANVRIQQVDSNRTFKSIPQTQVRPTLETAANINTRSVYEENYAKFIQTANKISHVHNAAKQASSTTTVTSTANSVQNTSLPKFNQAFGKAAFHNTAHGSTSEAGNDNESTNVPNNVAITNLPVIKTYKSDSTDNTILNTVVPNSISPVIIKRTSLPGSTSTVTTLAGTASRTAMTPLSVQTVQGGVIYTRQIPISANVNRSTVKIAQASPDTQPMVPVAVSSPVVVSKNSLIRNKVNNILTATFSSPVVSSNMQGSTNASFANQSQANSRDGNSSDDAPQTSVPQPLYALQTSLPIKLAVPSSTMFTNAKIVRPVVQIPGKLLTTTSPIKQQLVLTAAPTSTSRVCQNVRLADNMISTSPMDASVSSSTLEQLREFDMVLEQVKERSTVQPNLPVSAASPVSASSNISHGLLIPHSQSESTESEIRVSTNTSFGQELVFTTTVSPLAQRLNLTYMSQNLAKLAANAPVVVVTNYQQAPSPALSVTSQSSSSPCVTPAPTTPNSSAGKTPPKVSSKSKSKSVKTSSTNTSKASPVPKPPQKPQEDEQTAQRIYDILAEYAEQLRNSPDLNNKPAPRRRSNPSANPGPNSKRKKTSGSKRPSGQGTSTASEMSPGADDHHTMGSEDSSCGLVQISMQNSPSQGIPSVEDCLHADTSSDVGNIRSVQSDSSDCPTTEVRTQPSARHLIFTDPNNSQQRNVIIADSAVSEALVQVGKLGTSTAAVLVPGNYILPMSMVKAGQQITIVSGGSKILTTVPGRPGSNANTLVLQSILNQAQKPLLAQQSSSPMKMPSIQTVSGLTQHSVASNQAGLVQALTSTAQSTQQLTYIDTAIDKNNTSGNTASLTPQGTILINSSNACVSIPSTACSTNVTGFTSKSPAVVRTYSTITHTSGANNVPELTQSESAKVKDNFSGDSNSKLKVNIISDLSTIVSANNLISDSQGRYALSIGPQTVLCQSASHAISSADTQNASQVSKQKTTKDSSAHHLHQNVVESPNIVVSTANPVIKLVHSGARRIQSVNSNDIFEVSQTSQDQRTHSVLINANENAINGPLLSQVTNTAFQDLSTVISSSDTCDENIDGQSKINDLQKEEKSENGLSDQNEMFTKSNTPWRYVPTSSGVEFLTTMGDQIKFFRGNVDSNNDNAGEKNSDEVGIAKTNQIHMQSDLVRKRFVNSMICNAYNSKTDRHFVNQIRNATSRITKELQQQTMERKQAALERELRLQKSLSEECEDLGVDEPSTSDLFPEADLLFDPTHSFDQNSQDASCSQTVGKNYTRTNFKALDSSSNSGDADFVKVAPAKMDDSNNPEQRDNFLTEHQRSKIPSVEEHMPSGTSLRPSNNFIDQAQDDKKGSLSDFDNNSEFIFNATSFSRSVDDSCLELVFENTDKNSNKNGKDDSLHATHNSNSNSFESSEDHTTTEASPGLPSHKVINKFNNKYTYSNCKAKEDTDKIAWESELEHSTTEDEMQFTEDDSSQSQLDSFRGTSIDIEEAVLKSGLKRSKQDSLEGNGLNVSLGSLSEIRQSRKAECVLTNKKRTASQSHMENYSNSPVSPSEEHSEESNKGSTRRLSLRGHVKKNCPCCNGKPVADTPPAAKKVRSKLDTLKTIKPIKKSAVTLKSTKSNVSKKR